MPIHASLNRGYFSERAYDNAPVVLRPRVAGLSGAVVGILMRDGVGREPEPTAVFWGALDLDDGVR